MTRLVRSLAACMLISAIVGGSWSGEAASQANPIPLFAYYYIWFDPGSWDRAKSDLPLLGPYSSSDPEVLRQHVRWASSAGIDGFIVSWKSTAVLNERLATLATIAAEEDFHLAIIYQGLDFEREPLPVEQVVADLTWFAETYGADPVFRWFERPVVIWSGTWEFGDTEIASAAEQIGDRLLLLGSEQQVEDYERRAAWFDGNAYYWSSVDPVGTPGYEDKLSAMGEAVHRTGGVWIAPAAPGFDARLIGGARVVERNDGDTLRREMAAALASAPDAVGLISWNEFSENSHVEPSRNYGPQALEVLAGLRGGQVPDVPTFDSDEPADVLPSPDVGRLAPLLFVGGLIAVSVAVLSLRRARGRTPDRPEDPR